MPEIRVWAPAAGSVEVEVASSRRSLAPVGGGWWSAGVLAAGTDYAFRVDGSEPLPDPRSAHQPEGVHGPSRVVDHAAFAWTDGAWAAPPLAGAVIYELHIGTFTPGGTFESAVDRLDHLAGLGVTAVEIMPVAAFSGRRGWGYDGVDLYAPHHDYGGPGGLKRLVDECHRRGLGAILDVVYNHLGPEGNHLQRFGPYFSDRRRTPWGQAVNFDGPGSREVRRFVIDNALMWLRDYHFDGLRLDAVHAIVDNSPTPVLAELAAMVHALPGSRFLIAEQPQPDPGLLALGMDAQWDDELHHGLHVLFTGERDGYYAPYTGAGDIARALREPAELGIPYSRLLTYTQTHDQIGNRALGERLAHLVGPAALRLATVLTLLSPFVPMLFMGEEWAASSPFQFFSDHRDHGIARATSEGRMNEFKAFGWRAEQVPDPQAVATFERSRLDWSELGREPHSSVLDLYRELLALRRGLPPGTPQIEFDEAGGRLRMTRGSLCVDCDLRTPAVHVTRDGQTLLGA